MIMRLAWTLAIAFWLSFSASAMVVGHQQEPAVPASPAEQAPAPAVAPEDKIPAEANPRPEPKAPETAAKEKATATSVSSAHRTGSKKRRNRTPAPSDGTRKVVVREGGAKAPPAQIAPGMNPEEASRQRKNAEQLLTATDDQLKQLSGRSLDSTQQESVGQIRNYEEEARVALKEGDVRRASTLAEKAHLLAEDLARR